MFNNLNKKFGNLLFMIRNVDSAVHQFAQMWLRRMSLDEFASRCHIKRGTLSCWRHGEGSPKGQQIETMAYYLKCSYRVIAGYEPCTCKCPDCYLAQQ